MGNQQGNMPCPTRLVRLFLMFSVFGMTGCSLLQPDIVEEKPVVAAWSLIAGTDDSDSTRPAIVARFVIRGAGQDCGAYTLRSGQHTITPSERNNPDPENFPVTLCQAQLTAQTINMTLYKQDQLAQLTQADGRQSIVTFSGPASIGTRHPDELVLITFGDSGCRGDDLQPDCRLDGTDWPLSKLSKIASTEINPDLVIHLGDYRYFQAGLSADTWKMWYQDFFSAAQPLLLSSPWAFSRGNHEQCHNARLPYWYGTGWLYLFEPTISLQTTLCPAKPDPVLLKPWYFDIAAPGIDTHRFIMIDTAPDIPGKKYPYLREQRFLDFSNNFGTAIDWANASPSAWWMSHRPFLSLSYNRSGWRRSSKNFRRALYTALTDRLPLCNPDCSPNTFVAGHVHHHQKIELFKPGTTNGNWQWPQSVIVGTGGVKLTKQLYGSPCTYSDFSSKIAATGVVESHSDHGFVSWRRSAKTLGTRSGWIAEPYYIHGDQPARTGTLVPCTLAR